MKILIARGIESVHWSDVGDPKALDPEIMAFAEEHKFVVFTHDLDFGDILAVTHARGPSVIQARVEDPVPEAIGEAVVATITGHLTGRSGSENVITPAAFLLSALLPKRAQ